MNEIVDVPVRPKKNRHNRALTAATCFMFFMSSWIPAGFGLPGLTILLWAGLFSYILYRLIK